MEQLTNGHEVCILTLLQVTSAKNALTGGRSWEHEPCWGHQHVRTQTWPCLWQILVLFFLISYFHHETQLLNVSLQVFFRICITLIYYDTVVY